MVNIDIWPPRDWRSQFRSSYYDKLFESKDINIKQIETLHIRGMGRFFPLMILEEFILNRKRRKDALLHITTQMSAIETYNPYVLTFHDMLHLKPKLTGITYSAYKIKKIDACAINADKIITPSIFSMREIQHYFFLNKEKICVVYPGIDLDIFKKTDDKENKLKKYSFDERNFNLLFVGSQHPRKNLKTLISAVEVLKNKYKINGLTLWVVSKFNKENEEKILNFVRSMNLGENVHLLGMIPLDELILFYSQVDVFVLPTLMEGFGLPNVEVQACGCPVVSSNIEVMQETLGDSAALIDPMDPVEMAEIILKIKEDRDYREKLIEKGKANALKFSMQNSVEGTIKVYKEVADKHRSAATEQREIDGL